MLVKDADQGNRRGIPRLLMIAAGAAVVILTGFYLVRAWNARPYCRSEYLLGTMVEITAYGPRAKAGVERAFAVMREIEGLIDPRRPDADVARLAASAGRGPVEVDARVMAMLRLAEQWRPRTDGAFDVTIAPVVRSWGFAPGGEPHLPVAADLAAALALVNGADLLLDPAAGTAFLRRPGMAVDLGGMAKGYAVDLAYQALREAGVTRALINGGLSSIRVLGRPPHGGLWRIGIEHPRTAGRGFLAVLLLGPGQAVGTSADNQNFFMVEGERYSHLLDPRTGRPARGAILFTVVAEDAVTADLLSTACFIRGSAAGLQTAAAAGVEGLTYAPDGRIEQTAGLVLAES